MTRLYAKDGKVFAEVAEGYLLYVCDVVEVESIAELDESVDNAMEVAKGTYS